MGSTIKYLIKVIFQRKSGESYRTIIFYSVFISFTICLSLFLEIFTFTRNFFEYPYIIIYSTLFTSTIVSSSDSFNIIIRTAFQMMISCIIGDIVAYTAFVIFFEHIWITIFVFLVFIFLTTGPLLSSQNLPWSISKRMYFEYFLLIYVIKPTSRSPIIFLKSGLASILTMIFAFIGVFIMNPFFSSELFIRTAVKIIHRSHQCKKILGRQLEVKTMAELTSPLQKRAQKKILNDIHSRLSQSKTNIPVFFKDNNQEEEEGILEDNNLIDGDSKKVKIKKSVRKYLKTFRNVKTSIYEKRNNSNINKNNQNNQYYESNKNNLNLNISHLTPKTLKKKKELIIENSREIINNYKDILIKYNIKYSLNLNMLDTYLKECGFEFWNKDLVSHFKEIAIYLEKNHNIISSMQVSIEKDLTSNRCIFLLPLIPYINTIIHQTNNISVIMENQLLGNYRVHKTRNKIVSILKRFIYFLFGNKQYENKANQQVDEENQINEREIYKKSLEYSERRVLKYFERIEVLTDQLKKEYHKIELTGDLVDVDEESQCELSRIHCFLNLLCAYTVTQKRLSELVYSCSRCLNRQHKLYHFQMFILIGIWILNFPKYSWIRFKTFCRTWKNGKLFNRKEINILEPSFTFKEKLRLITKNWLKRILFKWKFSLKFSLFVSIISIGYYEITNNSDFILFRNSSWYVISILYVSAPSIGASGFFCFMRFFGTLLGVFSAYIVGVFFSLADHDATKALCYVALTFFLIFVINVFVRGKPIQTFGNFFILSYATITFPEYTDDHALIIITLLRWFHISLAVFTIMILSFILPYYDNRELELNLLDIATLELKSFKKVINYHLDLNIIDIENNQKVVNETIIDNNLHNRFYYHHHQYHRLPITEMLNSIPQDISKCSSFYSADYYLQKTSIDREAFKDILWPIFHNIRSKITSQRSLIFNSRFELLFKKKRYNHIKEFINLLSSQYMVLVGLEFIILDNSFNNKIFNSLFLDQVRLIIIPKLKFIVSELDYASESFIEIRKMKTENCKNRPIVFPTNLRILINEIYNDYHTLIINNNCSIEHTFSIHQLGCLIYTFDLFVNNHERICHCIYGLSKATIVERKGIEANYNTLKLVLENLKTNYSDYISDNSSFLFNMSNVNSEDFDDKSQTNKSFNSSRSSRNYKDSSSSSSTSSSASSSSGSDFSELEDEDEDLFIPFTRNLTTSTIDEKQNNTNNRFNKFN